MTARMMTVMVVAMVVGAIVKESTEMERLLLSLPFVLLWELRSWKTYFFLSFCSPQKRKLIFFSKGRKFNRWSGND